MIHNLYKFEVQYPSSVVNKPFFRCKSQSRILGKIILSTIYITKKSLLYESRVVITVIACIKTFIHSVFLQKSGITKIHEIFFVQPI
jgi:hypothetical protein